MPAYFFLHAPSGRSWATDDPHRWLLDHHDDDLLAAARDRLVASPAPDRCLRVVLRRRGLVLVHVVAEDKIVVHHWSEPAPDLRAWAKKEGFNCARVRVEFVNVKNNRVVVHEDGQDVLMDGQRVGDGFPWDEYAVKYERRQVEEAGDESEAPASATNFIWPGVPPGKMTWRVLKAIWRAKAVWCPNCDRPLVFVAVNWNRGMLSYRSAKLNRHCLGCRRRFEADEDRPLVWLATALEPHLWPSHLTLWRPFEIDWCGLHPRLV